VKDGYHNLPIVNRLSRVVRQTDANGAPAWHEHFGMANVVGRAVRRDQTERLERRTADNLQQVIGGHEITLAFGLMLGCSPRIPHCTRRGARKTSE
jgi:hypothetical protein